eukprot:scaffold10583_cov118-Isochrysis_galbana.AAC.1
MVKGGGERGGDAIVCQGILYALPLTVRLHVTPLLYISRVGGARARGVRVPGECYSIARVMWHVSALSLARLSPFRSSRNLRCTLA